MRDKGRYTPLQGQRLHEPMSERVGHPRPDEPITEEPRHPRPNDEPTEEP
jgi:hypothetical protein